MKKILITGASGFIGSCLADVAIEQGYEVYAGVRPSSDRRFLNGKPLQYFEMDFSAPSSLQQSLLTFNKEQGGFDLIIHNAGITQARKKSDFITVNFHYTRNLADAILASGMKIQKLAYISSLATYGPGNEKTLEPIHAGQSRQPISSYGKSKLMAEEYLLSLKNLPSLIIQPTAVYGPRDRDFLQFVKLVKNRFEPYLGREKQLISMVHVMDLSRAILSLIGMTDSPGPYIISDGKAYSKEDLGAAIKKTLRKKTFKIKLPYKPLQLALSGFSRMHELVFRTQPFLNPEKLHEISRVNWLCQSNVWEIIRDRPSFDLESGIAQTIDWYRQNKWL